MKSLIWLTSLKPVHNKNRFFTVYLPVTPKIERRIIVVNFLLCHFENIWLMQFDYYGSNVILGLISDLQNKMADLSRKLKLGWKSKYLNLDELHLINQILWIIVQLQNPANSCIFLQKPAKRFERYQSKYFNIMLFWKMMQTNAKLCKTLQNAIKFFNFMLSCKMM